MPRFVSSFCILFNDHSAILPGSVMEPPEPPGSPKQLSPASPASPGRSLASPASPRTVSKVRVSTTGQSVGDRPSIVGRGWMSMEQLRQHYDAVVVGSTSQASPSGNNENLGQSAFPCLGRVLLCLVGHLQFGTGLPSWLFSFFSFAVLPVSLTGLLVCATAVVSGAVTHWSMTMVLTLCFFQLGVSFASVTWWDDMQISAAYG